MAVGLNNFEYRFKELSTLGSGSYGTVVKVEEKITKGLSAVKKLRISGSF